MNKKNVTSKIIVFFVAAFLLFAAAALAADYTLLMPMHISKSAKGEQGDIKDSASGILSKICDILSAKTGDNYTCKVISKPNDTMFAEKKRKQFIKNIEDEKFTAIYLSSNDYYQLVSSGYDRLVPVAALSFFKKNYDQVCFYTREADKIEQIEQLRGKKWAGSFFYTGARYILFKNGIDEPLDKFFGKISVETDDFWTNSAERLINGEIDVFTGSIEEETLGRLKDKKFKAIKRQFCVIHRSTHLIAFNKSVPPEKIQKMRGILLNAHKDKDFQQFWFIFSAIQGHFIPFEEEAFKYTKEFVDTYEQRGWLKEYFKFVGE